jgi:hypothetical protein
VPVTVVLACTLIGPAGAGSGVVSAKRFDEAGFVSTVGANRYPTDAPSSNQSL